MTKGQREQLLDARQRHHCNPNAMRLLRKTVMLEAIAIANGREMIVRQLRLNQNNTTASIGQKTNIPERAEQHAENSARYPMRVVRLLVGGTRPARSG